MLSAPWLYLVAARWHAIIAAIALTLRKRKDSKFQDPSEQIRVQPQDRVRLVKMKSVVPEIVDPVKAPLAEEKK
jgi:NADH-quinone oxidoreductase subunit J